MWREALLAQKVLQGLTRGYRNHPQLIRFRRSPDPVLYVGTYLYYIYLEAEHRGYKFDISRIRAYDMGVERIPVTIGQLNYEFRHLLVKLKKRDPEKHREVVAVKSVQPHPLFRAVPGEVEEWEKAKGTRS